MKDRGSGSRVEYISLAWMIDVFPPLIRASIASQDYKALMAALRRQRRKVWWGGTLRRSEDGDERRDHAVPRGCETWGWESCLVSGPLAVEIAGDYPACHALLATASSS